MPKFKTFTPQNKLRTIRQNLSVTLAYVADKTNVTTAQIQKLETGDRGLSCDMMRQLAKVYEMMPADIFLPSEGGLEPDERQIIDLVRRLSPAQRQVVMEMLRGLSNLEASPPPP